MTARALQLHQPVPPPTVRLLSVATVLAEIVGADVKLSAWWIRERFAPEHRIRLGRGVYWPEAEARAWWARYVRDLQGAR